MTAPPPASRHRRTDVAVLLALLVGTFALYLPTLQNDFVDYDDQKYVTQNEIVQRGLTIDGVRWAFTTNHFANWLPVTWLSHMLDVSLFGLNAGGHHATSAVLHAMNAALVLVVLRAMTGSRWRSLAAAVLFAVHPLRVESVAWIAERKDVLAGTFFLLTLWAYVAWTQRGTGWRYTAAVVTCALGLMSKTMLVTVPGVLLLIDVWPLRRVRIGKQADEAARVSVRRALVEKIPFVLLSAIACAWTIILQRDGGMMYPSDRLPLGTRLANAIVGVPRYLGKMLWPADLSVLYRHPFGWPVTYVIAAALVICGITLIAWRVRRAHPYLLFGWAWFLGMLVPVSGIVQVGLQSIADRYTYLPGIGLAVAVVWAATSLMQRRGSTRMLRRTVFATMVLCLAVATVRQQRVWKNTESLFTHAIALDGQHFRFMNAMAKRLGDRRDFAGAADYYRRCIALRPGHAPTRYDYANMLARAGDLPGAAQQYADAIGIDPNLAVAHYNLAVLDARRGDVALAAARFAEAVRIEPDNTDFRVALATALANIGDLPAARAQAEEAVRRDPQNPRALRKRAELGGDPGPSHSK